MIVYLIQYRMMGMMIVYLIQYRMMGMMIVYLIQYRMMGMMIVYLIQYRMMRMMIVYLIQYRMMGMMIVYLIPYRVPGTGGQGRLFVMRLSSEQHKAMRKRGRDALKVIRACGHCRQGGYSVGMQCREWDAEIGILRAWPERGRSQSMAGRGAKLRVAMRWSRVGPV